MSVGQPRINSSQMQKVALNASPRDVYANLLRDTRGLSDDQVSAKTAWFETVPTEQKGEALFELEMLLKGLACFGDPRNLPGQPATPALSQDYHGRLRIIRDAVERVIALAESLLSDGERGPVLARYLDSVRPDDALGRREVHEQLARPTPRAALVSLHQALTQLVELSEGVLRLGHVPSRVYFAIHGLLVREIAHSQYFSPLTTLEFCPELDRIEHPSIARALASIRSEGGHRVSTLTFLSLFRADRYLTMIETYAVDPLTTRRAFTMLAVLRSDLRALTRYLARSGAEVMADCAENELFETSAADLVANFPELRAGIRSLVRIRAALDHIASTLRVDIKKVFEHDLVSPETDLSSADLAAKLHLAATEIRASIHHAIQTLAHEIRPGTEIFDPRSDPITHRASSVRARQQVWMFQQIVRAFIAKADAMTRVMSEGSHDRWSEQASFQFAQDFLGHFRAIGNELIRAHRYERQEPLLASLERLRNVDLIEASGMQDAIDECRLLLEFLGGLVESVSGRPELRGVPFDRHGAGDALKIYLGRG